MRKWIMLCVGGWILSGAASAQTNFSLPSKILCARFHHNSLYIGTFDRGVFAISDIFAETLKPEPVVVTGLPSKINDLVFKDDSIWVAATDDGLFIIKNNRITEVFNLNNGIPSNVIQCLEISPNGALWVGTNRGLGQFYRNNYRSYNVNLGLPDDDIHFIRSDENNRVWVATAKGLTLIDEKGTKIIPQRGIVSMTLDQDGQPFFGTTEGGIWFLRNDSMRPILQYQRFVYKNLYTDEVRRIWAVNSDTMLLEISKKNESPILINQTSSFKEIRRINPKQILVDLAGNIYLIGDFNIFIKVNTGEEKQYADHIRSLAEENLYIGRYAESKIYYELLVKKLESNNASVFRYYGYVLENLGETESAINAYQRAIELASNSNDPLYKISSQESIIALAGLYSKRNDPKAIELLSKLALSAGTAGEKAAIQLIDHYLAQKDTQNAILQYQQFIQLFPASDKVSSSKKELALLYQAKRDPRYEILLDSLFDHINDLESIYALDSIYQVHQFESLLQTYKNRFNDINKDRYTWEERITCSYLENQTLWLGTAGQGIIRISPVLADKKVTYAITRFNTDSGLAHNFINDISVDAKGNKWFGCGNPDEQGKEAGGLSKFDNFKWTKYTAQQGFVSNRVMSAVTTKSRIYVANTKGLFASPNTNYPNWYKVTTPSNAIPEKLVMDPLETIWFLSKNKIYSGTEQKFTEIPFDTASVSVLLQINQFHLDESGGIIALTNRGVYKFESGRFKLFLEPKDSTIKNINVFLVDQNGTISWGHSGGLTRQTEQVFVPYTYRDGLPSDSVLRIFPFYKEQIIVTNRGVWYHEESARDSVQWLQAVQKELGRISASANWNRYRTICRSMYKQNTEPDYFVYQIGRSYESEGKPVESLTYLNDYLRSKKRTKFFNEYTFFRLAKTFEKIHDYERASAIYDGIIRAFSSDSDEPDLELQELAAVSCDVATEKNPLIVNLEKSYIALAEQLFADKKIDQALLIYKKLPQIFKNSAHSGARSRLIARADTVRASNNMNGLLKVLRTFTRFYPDTGEAVYSQALYESGLLYQKLDQNREASEAYRDLIKLPKIVLLRPELTALYERTSQIAQLGLRTTSGFSETNSINTMEFEGNFLWLGTSKGVVRWDMSSGGYKKITSQNGLLSDYVYAMLIDSGGGKWFATANLAGGPSSGGVSYFDGETFTNYTTANGLASNQVRAIAQEKNGTIWAGTDLGVSKFENSKWTNFDLKRTHEFAMVTDLYFDVSGQLWISLSPKADYENQTGGVMKFDPVKPTVYLKKNGLTSNSVKSINSDPGGQLWFSTGEGLSIYNPTANTWKSITKKEGLISNNVRSVEGLQSDPLWIATDQGLMSWTNPAMRATRSADADNTEVKKVFSEKEGLTTNDIRVIRMHPEFGVWIGSKRGTFSVGHVAKDAEDKEILSRNNKLFEISTESEALFDRAQKYIEQGDYDKAREVYLDVLDRVANSEWADDATYLLAKSYELEGKYDEAEKTYQKLVKEHPESDLVAGAFIGLGTIYEKQKQFDKAEEAFGSAEASAKDKATVEQAKILSEKAKVKLISSERAKTEDLAQQISQKYVELEQAKTEEERNRIKGEIAELEKKANVSAKAGGFQMNLYKVREGESLWYLSEKFLGDAKKWKDFFIANEGKVSDPNLIITGQTIVVLTIEKGYKEKMDKFLFYDVAAGEDLETIASKLYGDKEKWKILYEMNKEKLSPSPRKSLAKMKIIIPVYDN